MGKKEDIQERNSLPEIDSIRIWTHEIGQIWSLTFINRPNRFEMGSYN